MNQAHGPRTRATFQKGLWELHGLARGVTLPSLGYDGPDYDHPTSVADLLDQRVTSRDDQTSSQDHIDGYRKARILRGAIAWSGRALIDGLFADIVTLRTMKRGTGTADTVAESEILSQLPRGFAHLFTAQFAQQLLAVTVEMTTRMADKWEGPTCIAQEFAIHLLVKKIETLVQDYDLDVDDDWSGAIYQGLMWDNDFIVFYGTPKTMAVSTDDWFKPFSGDTTVPPYSHFTPNEGPRAPEHSRNASGEGLAANRWENVAMGSLVEVPQPLAVGAGYVPDMSVAISQNALEALSGRRRTSSPEAEVALHRALLSSVAAAIAEPEATRVVFEATPVGTDGRAVSVRLVASVDEEPGNGVACVTIELACAPGARGRTVDA